MTCIVALVKEGKSYIGADSAGTNNAFSLQHRKDEKVFKVDDFLIGFTSSFRMGQLLRFSFTPPEYKESENLFKYMCTDFINGVRQCFKDGGYTNIENSVESGGEFIVMFRSRIFIVQPDFQVAEIEENYASVGCGFDLALGSLFSTKAIERPEDRIDMALRASERFSAGVCSPFIILKG